MSVKLIELSSRDDLFSHLLRVGNLSFELAVRLGLEEDLCYKCFIAGCYHDHGKLFLKKEILNKPSKLSNAEMEYVKTHVFLGALEVYKLEEDLFILNSILHHHENYNGTGYPWKLKYEDIPIGARILRVADSYDALISRRSYKAAYSSFEAISIMNNESDFYDPEVFNQLKEYLNMEGHFVP